MSSAWIGKPKWTGEVLNVDWENKFVAYLQTPFGIEAPFVIKIDDCDDCFLPVFSTEEALKEAMAYFAAKSGMEANVVKEAGEYRVVKLPNGNELFNALSDLGIRIMLDPKIINDHHTKWSEPIKEGTNWVLYNEEMN